MAKPPIKNAMDKAGTPVLPKPEKPKLRGKLHLVAAFVALIGGAVLVAMADSSLARVSAFVYSLTLVAMFGVSAVYHIPNWSQRARRWLRRLDHSAIYLSIAGTATPLFCLALNGEDSRRALILMWTGAIIGFLQSLFWIRAPKAVSAILYVVLGWLAVPYLSAMAKVIGSQGVAWLLSGGIIYSVGAIVYALRRPNLFPKVFGYHELFHALVIVASACHYILIFQIVS